MSNEFTVLTQASFCTKWMVKSDVIIEPKWSKMPCTESSVEVLLSELLFCIDGRV